MIARFLSLILACTAAASAAGFTVEARQLRNDRGVVRALLFQQSAGFPDTPAAATARSEAKAVKGTVRLSFKDVKPGRYAVSILHDEDGDGKAATNFIGIPTEGVGVSGPLGNSKPVFAKCLIDVAPGGAVTVTMKYW